MNDKIREAMIAKEKSVLAFIHEVGVYKSFGIPASRSFRRALERLETKGLVRWSKKYRGYVHVKKEEVR